MDTRDANSPAAPCNCALENERIVGNISRCSPSTLSSAPPPTQASASAEESTSLPGSLKDSANPRAALGKPERLSECIIAYQAVNSIRAGGANVGLPKASIGGLELERQEQAIVVQESLKHFILRLAAMLQDIEEEVALLTMSQVDSELRDRGVRELITRFV
ncbi:hypothetical protein GGR57DRAFT_509124 [Xylariaceae sp. FL1272]|nr:hypothetical protein GGR57DRAFT_509124 [Xylariaceae sp. FL1272]